MDWEKREELVAGCGTLKHYNGGAKPESIPLIAIEEFFDGAEDEGGLLCNTLTTPDDYSSAPDDNQVIALLTSIRSKPNVSDVRIAITQIDDDCWPFSDTILIVTTATDDEVIDWFPDGMKPDEIYTRDDGSFVPAAPSVPVGHRMVWVWFD